MNTMMINALCPGVKVDRWDSPSATDIKLTLEPVAWTGVKVAADKALLRRDGNVVEEWRVRINWPACGAQDVEQTEAFARLLKAAVYVAGELMKEKVGPEPDTNSRLAPDTRPQLPEGIDWTEPGVWEDFRATHAHCRGHFFLFSGVRFSPDLAKLLLDTYAAEPLPDYGDLMTVTEFKNAVDCGMFTDYDGSGEYATATHTLRIPVDLSDLDMAQTHVVWFNR